MSAVELELEFYKQKCHSLLHAVQILDYEDNVLSVLSGDVSSHHTTSTANLHAECQEYIKTKSITFSNFAKGLEDQLLPTTDESVDDDIASRIEHPPSTIHSFSHRAHWLVILLVFQSISSFILARFQFILETSPSVIYFLTMLVGAGGNAGCQSTVLFIREFAKREHHDPNLTDAAKFSVKAFLLDQAWVGFRLGFILTAVSFLRTFVFNVRLIDIFAICTSMYCIVFVSCVIGTLLPVILWKSGIDPAHAGACIQVTMDITGVFLTCLITTLIVY